MPIVHATAISHNAGGMRSGFSRRHSDTIQRVMAAAARECYRKGVTEPEVVRKAMLDARAEAKRLLGL